MRKAVLFVSVLVLILIGSSAIAQRGDHQRPGQQGQGQGQAVPRSQTPPPQQASPPPPQQARPPAEPRQPSARQPENRGGDRQPSARQPENRGGGKARRPEGRESGASARPMPSDRNPADQSRRPVPGNAQPRGQAEPRTWNFSAPELRHYGFQRPRTIPTPHPQFGRYYGGHFRWRSSWFWRYEDYYFFWRPFYCSRCPAICFSGSIDCYCIPGHWEWDSWCGCWVWVRGFCNIPGHRHPPGFYDWFNFR